MSDQQLDWRHIEWFHEEFQDKDFGKWYLVGWWNQFDQFHYDVGKYLRSRGWINRAGDYIADPDYYTSVPIPDVK